MKRLFSLLLTLLLAVSLAVPAFADVLWEPEDSFYKKHANECEVLRRSFYTNGDDGYVNLYVSPEKDSLAGQLTNGVSVHVYWQYQDWGYVEADKFEGWVPLSQLQLIYDYLSFDEEHGAEFVPYDEAKYAPMMEKWTGSTLAMFPYPGATEPPLWQDATGAMNELASSGFSHIYTDEQGLTWGFRSYLWGSRNFWVCLDAPAGRDDPAVTSGKITIPLREVEQPELTPSSQPQLPMVYRLAYILAAVVSMFLVYLLGKKYGPKRGLKKR